MNAELKTESKTKTSNRRRRRHWYDHEKIAIVEKYDRGELYPIPGQPDCVVDPKSKEELLVSTIRDWRNHLIDLGLIKKPRVAAEPVAVKTPVDFKGFLEVTPTDAKEASMQNLLVQTLLENQKLKEMLGKVKQSATRLKKVETSFSAGERSKTQ